MSLQNNVSREHKKVHDLLPWWVNKTLETNEHALVDEHLRTCVSCQQEVVFLQSLNSAVDTSGQMDSQLGSSSSCYSEADVNKCLMSVMDRIDSDSRKVTNRNVSLPFWSKLSNVVAGYNSFQWSAAAVAGLLAVVVGFKLLTPGVNQDYSVLSQSDAPVTPIQLEVLFADSVLPEQARQIIQTAADRLDVAVQVQLTGADTYIVGYNDSVEILELSNMVIKLESNDSVKKVDIVH